MMSVVATDTAGNNAAEVVLFDEQNRPTKLLIGLVALELAIDAFIGYSVFRFLKGR